MASAPPRASKRKRRLVRNVGLEQSVSVTGAITSEYVSTSAHDSSRQTRARLSALDPSHNREASPESPHPPQHRDALPSSGHQVRIPHSPVQPQPAAVVPRPLVNQAPAIHADQQYVSQILARGFARVVGSSIDSFQLFCMLDKGAVIDKPKGHFRFVCLRRVFGNQQVLPFLVPWCSCGEYSISYEHINVCRNDAATSRFCLHCSALIHALGGYTVVLDHIANDTPWQEVEESHKQMQRLVFCTPAGDEVSVGAKRYYAVLSTTWSVLCAKLNTGKIICCMCNTNKCRHYKNVMGDLPQDEGPDSAEIRHQKIQDDISHFIEPITKRRKATCVSWHRIPDCLDGDAARAMHVFMLQAALHAAQGQDALDLSIPANQQCVCGCTNWIPHANNAATIVSSYGLIPARVPQLQCSDCSSVMKYDGASDHILNYDDSLLFSHELLASFNIEMTSGSDTFNRRVVSTLQRFVDNMGIEISLAQSMYKQRSKWQEAFYSYEALMWRDYLAAFSCPTACSHSRILLDGTINATLQTMKVFLEHHHVGSNMDEMARGLAFDTCAFLVGDKMNRIRALGQRFSSVSHKFDKKQGKVIKHNQGLTLPEYSEFCLGLQRHGSRGQALLGFLRHFEQDLVRSPVANGGELVFAPPKISQLVYALCSPSVLSAVLPKCTHENITEILRANVGGISPSCVENLLNYAPLVARVLLVCTKDYTQAVPQPVHHLLEVMLQQSTAIVSCPPSKYQMELVQQPAHNSVEDKLAAALDELWKTGTFLPDHPILRKVAHIYLADKHNDSDSACRKFNAKTGKVLPGVLLVFCMDHQQCIGFQLMDQSESPRMVFELFFTRWSICPKELHYDHACHTHTFAMYREPAFFAEMRAYIDKLHIGGHKGCSPAYDPYLYTRLMSENSQLAEQTNSKVLYVQPRLIHMGQLNFFHTLLSFLTLLNIDTKKAKNGLMINPYLQS